MFIKILAQTHLWTKQSPPNLESHPDLDSGSADFRSSLPGAGLYSPVHLFSFCQLTVQKEKRALFLPISLS